MLQSQSSLPLQLSDPVGQPLDLVLLLGSVQPVLQLQPQPLGPAPLQRLRELAVLLVELGVLVALVLELSLKVGQPAVEVGQLLPRLDGLPLELLLFPSNILQLVLQGAVGAVLYLEVDSQSVVYSVLVLHHQVVLPQPFLQLSRVLLRLLQALLVLRQSLL